MSLQLHGYWRSSATYRVRIALHLKQLDFEYIPVHLVKDGGQQHQAAYIGLNPSRLVPTFVDDDEDIVLNQSLAIMEYIDEKYQSRHKLLPDHTLDRARVRAVCQDIACDVQPVTNLRIIETLKKDFAADPSSIIQWQQSWMKLGFTALEKRLQTRAGKYCFGYDVTMADICLVPQVYNALRFELEMKDFPLIYKIYENCNQLPAFAQATPEKQIDAI